MKYPQLSDFKWLTEQLITKGRSTRDVQKEVGCSHGGVMYATRRFNIEIPEKKSGPKPGTDMRAISKESYRKKYPKGRFGALASHWKGGKRNLGKHRAYIGIFMPDHPNATADGYILEHRLVMEKKLGRYLTRGELVHHINGIKHDNRIENLSLMDGHGEHSRHHFDAVKEVDRLRKMVIELGGNPDSVDNLPS